MPSQVGTLEHSRMTTSRMATPPPLPSREFPAGIGWVDGQTIGFRGFHNADDAARAALIAFRAMNHRLVGGRASVASDADVAPVIAPHGDAEVVVVNGRSIARLVRLGSMLEGASGSVAFELEVPVPMSNAGIREMAGHLYREMHRLDAERVRDEVDSVHELQHVGAQESARASDARSPIVKDYFDRWIGTRVMGGVVAGLTVLTMFALAALLPAITSVHVVAVLGSIAAVFAGLALVSLVGMMLRPSRSQSPVAVDAAEKNRGWHPDSRFWYSAGFHGRAVR